MLKKYIRNSISKIRGNSFDREYLEIKNINSKEKLLDFQKKYLTELLLHSYENVPYYRRIFKEIGIVNNGIVDISKFDKIPVLTKDILRNNKELISNDHTERKCYYKSTGGSTGEPVRFIQDELYNKWGNIAAYYYYRDILGIDEPNAKKVVLWGSERDLLKGSIGPRAKLINWLNNTIFLNCFRMTEKDMDSYIKIINSYKPDLIRGYAGSLYELCSYAKRKNLIIHSPKIIISAAETLRDEMREKIEQVLRTKVYNHYGSRETNNLAGECKEGLMHVFMFHNYVEILDANNQPVSEGEEGRVIVTNLHNYSMPFIRYEIGDWAVLGPKKCKCGNMLSTLEKVSGRITDHFLLENGAIVPAEFFIHMIGVVCNKGSIKKFQVIQEDYKTIKILVVPEGEINELERNDIEDKLKIVMGWDCKIIWDFVEEIPKTESGKYLYTKCLVGGKSRKSQL